MLDILPFGLAKTREFEEGGQRKDAIGKDAIGNDDIGTRIPILPPLKPAAAIIQERRGPEPRKVPTILFLISNDQIDLTSGGGQKRQNLQGKSDAAKSAFTLQMLEGKANCLAS
jgi:hypothetical protein